MADAKQAQKGVRSPLQLFGLYLAWIESALAASLFATTIDYWARCLLVLVMAAGLVLYVCIAGFLLIYLVVKKPAFLFNPSDFDKSVQHMLFGRSGTASARNASTSSSRGAPP